MVLAGGAARRLGGVDKPRLTVGGRTLLDRVLVACTGARRTVVVGPGESAGEVRWTREQPPGGGPVAAVAAGLAAGAGTAPVLLLLAADLPFLDAATVRRLVAAVTGPVQAAVLVDGQGREQPLVGAYRSDALRAALAGLGEPAGQPLRRLVGGLRTVRLADPDRVGEDCDTWEAVAAARHRAEISPGVQGAGERNEATGTPP